MPALPNGWKTLSSGQTSPFLGNRPNLIREKPVTAISLHDPTQVTFPNTFVTAAHDVIAFLHAGQREDFILCAANYEHRSGRNQALYISHTLPDRGSAQQQGSHSCILVWSSLQYNSCNLCCWSYFLSPYIFLLSYHNCIGCFNIKNLSKKLKIFFSFAFSLAKINIICKNESS